MPRRRPGRGGSRLRAARAAGGRRGTSGWWTARSSEKGQLPHHELTASACMFMHIVGLALPYTSFSMTSPPHYEKPKRWRALVGFKRVGGHSCRAFCILLSVARTARLSPSGGMADTEVSKTSGGNLVRVRPSPRAPSIRPAPRIARPAFSLYLCPNAPSGSRRSAALAVSRRPAAPGVTPRSPQAGAPRARRPFASGANQPQPPAANPPIAGRGCVQVPSSSWCRHRGQEADTLSAESRPPHGAGSRAWRACRRHEDPSCPRYRQRWCRR